MNMVLITPRQGVVHVSVDGVEHIKPMSSHEMMILIERLSSAARVTLMAERNVLAGGSAGGWSDEATLALK